VSPLVLFLSPSCSFIITHLLFSYSQTADCLADYSRSVHPSRRTTAQVAVMKKKTADSSGSPDQDSVVRVDVVGGIRAGLVLSSFSGAVSKKAMES